MHIKRSAMVARKSSNLEGRNACKPYTTIASLAHRFDMCPERSVRYLPGQNTQSLRGFDKWRKVELMGMCRPLHYPFEH